MRKTPFRQRSSVDKFIEVHNKFSGFIRLHCNLCRPSKECIRISIVAVPDELSVLT